METQPYIGVGRDRAGLSLAESTSQSAGYTKAVCRRIPEYTCVWWTLKEAPSSHYSALLSSHLVLQEKLADFTQSERRPEKGHPENFEKI